MTDSATKQSRNTVMTPGKADWLEDIRSWFAQWPQHSAGVIVLPSYRPDAVTALAAALGLARFDFRQEKLAPLGWKAAQVPLHALNEAALEIMEKGTGVVLHNAEALLSLHDAATRRAWFDEVLGATWPQPLLLPVCLFDGELPAMPGRVYRVAAGSLPEQSLLMRLASV